MTDRPSSESAASSASTVLMGVVLGGIIGAAGTFAAIHASGYSLEKKSATPDLTSQPLSGESAAAGAPAGGGPAAGGPPPMMGMGGGMGMMMGGGGGPNGKRSLTNLVGKLELLTRGNLNLALDAEQAAKFASKLEELEKTDKLTADEAQKDFEELEGLLTPDQKAVVDAIGLPFGGGRGGRGGPGGGPGGGMGGMMGRGGPPGGQDDENPFKQETNEKRLHDFLARLKPASGQ